MININLPRNFYSIENLIRLRLDKRIKAFIGTLDYLYLILDEGVACVTTGMFFGNKKTSLEVKYFCDVECKVTRTL